MNMKALTIIQPYATMIIKGGKRVENRTWYTHYRGIIAIHAGAGRKYQGNGSDEIAREYGIDFDKLVYGAVIGTAKLVEVLTIGLCRELHGQSPYGWIKSDPLAFGPYCWVLEDAKPLPRPMLYRGALGLWDWDGTEQIPIPKPPAGKRVKAKPFGLFEPGSTTEESSVDGGW